MTRYLVISAFTFTLDLAILSLTHGRLGWPLPAAVTAGYAVALSTNYLLNRVLNFRSHAPLGPESLRYAGAVAVNFGVVLLGVTTGLAALGVPYQVARVAAGTAEGAFMYCAMRWFVFAPASRAGTSPGTSPGTGCGTSAAPGDDAVRAPAGCAPRPSRRAAGRDLTRRGCRTWRGGRGHRAARGR